MAKMSIFIPIVSIVGPKSSGAIYDFVPRYLGVYWWEARYPKSMSFKLYETIIGSRGLTIGFVSKDESD